MKKIFKMQSSGMSNVSFEALTIVLIMVALMLFSASLVFAESQKLRLLVWEGYAPEKHLEIFKHQVKERHGIDLEIKVKYASEYMDYRHALINGNVDLITTSHNYPKNSEHNYIKGKITLPIDVGNISHFNDILPDLQKTDFLTQKGEVYAVPFIYGPYGLAYNTNIIKQAPKSWKILWDPKYAGKYTIASTINITNIYITALAMGIDKSKMYQFKSVYSPEFVNSLTYLAKNVRSFYGAVETADDLKGLSLAACWGFAFSELKQQGEIWKMAEPEEGTTCYIDCWMISHTLRNKPKLKQIAEEWIDYTLSPDFQITHVARELSCFPVNLSIKAQMTPEEIQMYHLNDLDYFRNNFIPWEVIDIHSQKGFELLWKKATR